MMWRPIALRPLCFLLLAPAFLAGTAGMALAQDRSAQDRLERVERDLSMLQRQVYRGTGGGGSAVGADPTGAVNAQIRMDRIEEQMRELTGRVEEALNGVDQLRRRLEQINSDIDVRLNGGVAASPSASAATSRVAATTSRAPTASTGGFLTLPSDSASAGGSLTPPGRIPPGTAVPPPPAQSAGQLTPPGRMPAAGQQAALSPGGGVPGDQYTQAFGQLQQKDYSGAEQAFKTFLAQHPEDPRAANAQYWLGETFYARARYGDAATIYAEGYKRYPKGPKAADNLLKLGMSLGRENQNKGACVVFAQLDRDFPNPGAAIKERVLVERKRLSC